MPPPGTRIVPRTHSSHNMQNHSRTTIGTQKRTRTRSKPSPWPASSTVCGQRTRHELMRTKNKRMRSKNRPPRKRKKGPTRGQQRCGGGAAVVRRWCGGGGGGGGLDVGAVETSGSRAVHRLRCPRREGVRGGDRSPPLASKESKRRVLGGVSGSAFSPVIASAAPPARMIRRARSRSSCGTARDGFGRFG